MKDFLFIDTEILTAMIYPNIPSRPGIIPAKNNCPISWLVIIPYKTASQSGITSLSFQFEIPTVSSNINGLNELIKDNETGYLFNRNPTDLALKINNALKSDRKNIINNIITLKKELTWKKFIIQILKNI